MKKRILGILLALCMVLSVMSATVLAAEVTESVTVTVAGTDFEAAPNKTIYLKSTSETAVEDITSTYKNDEATPWNIKLANTGDVAELTIQNLTVNGKLGKGIAALKVSGNREVKILVAGNEASVLTTNEGASLEIATTKNATITSVNNSKLELRNNTTGNYYPCRFTGSTEEGVVNTLTFDNVNLLVTSKHAGNYAYAAITVTGNLEIKGGTVAVEANGTATSGICVSQTLSISNGADVNVAKISLGKDQTSRDLYAVVANSLQFSSGKLTISDLADYMFLNYKDKDWNSGLLCSFEAGNKRTAGLVPEFSLAAGGSVRVAISEDSFGSNATVYEGADVASKLEALNAEKSLASYRYISICTHPNVAAQTDCSVAVTCSCGAVAHAAKEHTVPVGTTDCTTAKTCTVCNKVVAAAAGHTGGTATCTTKAVCSVCNKEYGELAAHTPKAGTYACSEAHPCANCSGNYREAGSHAGGTATCKDQAKCVSCGTAYGELAACTPAADDGDCSTAIKCSVCGKETTAALTHKYTNTTDTTCDNAGCTHTRIVESGNKNPQTGDNTAIILMAVLAAVSTVAVVFTKKRAI